MSSAAAWSSSRTAVSAPRSSFPRSFVLERVSHPDVRLPVAPLITLSVDLDGRQATRKPVVAAFGERHARPALPLGHGPGNPQRPRFRLQDGGAEALVHAHPRIEQPPVWPSPLRVSLDLDKWVAVLPNRPNGCDQRPELVPTCDRCHRLDCRGAYAPALEIARDHDDESAQHVRAALVEA